MRIIAGKFRGRKLSCPKVVTRPTLDRVREALFSILGDLSDLNVIDFYAGSGALGLEALSRGAASATFVEKDAAAIKVIRDNAAALGADRRIQTIGGSALALPRAEPFDIIFADPPYGPDAGTAAFRAITAAGWLAAGGWCSVETARDQSVDAGGLEVEVERDIGPARITLLRRPSA